VQSKWDHSRLVGPSNERSPNQYDNAQIAFFFTFKFGCACFWCWNSIDQSAEQRPVSQLPYEDPPSDHRAPRPKSTAAPGSDRRHHVTFSTNVSKKPARKMGPTTAPRPFADAHLIIAPAIVISTDLLVANDLIAFSEPGNARAFPPVGDDQVGRGGCRRAGCARRFEV